MSTLPASWVRVPISEVSEINPRKNVDLGGDNLVSFVPMAAVDELSGTIATPVNRPYSEVSHGFTHFCNGDVIFAKITPSMENGKAAVARELTNNTGMGSTEFHVFRTYGAIEPEYLWFYLRQQSFRDDAKSVMSGAVGQQRVPADWLKQHPIPLAPKPEQRRIVEKVDSLIKRTARAQKELSSIPSLIARYKERLLALALNGDLSADWRAAHGSKDWMANALRELGQRRADYEKAKRGSRLHHAPPLDAGDASDLPSSWVACCVADVADLRVGYAFKSQWFSGQGLRLLRGANVAPGRLDWTDERRLAQEHVSRYAAYSLDVGDVVIAMDRPLISTGLKIAIIDENSAGALLVQRVANPRATSWIHPKYMYYMFNGRDFISHVKNYATGSNLPHISGNDIQTAAVPLPPFEEQVEIVRRVDSAIEWLDRVASDHAAAKQLLPKLNEAILTKAFIGGLVPQDPDDEPANLLLERVVRERASPQPPTTTSKPKQSSKARKSQKAQNIMTKSRRDADVWQKPYLAGKLKQLRTADVRSLFRASELSIAEFYKQLAWEISQKYIIDTSAILRAA